MLDQNEATIKANALAQELGKGWTEDVWENMGWYYHARSPGGTVTVFPSGGGKSYLALIHNPGTNAGQMGLSGKGTSAREAVDETVALTRKEIAKLEQWLEGVN